MSIVNHNMQPTMTAALLKRSDAPLWRLYFGEDWGPFAEQLGEHHCFEVFPVLVAPSLLPGAQERLEPAVRARGLQLRKGWFEATPEQAMAVLWQALPCASQPTSEPVVVESPLLEPVAVASPVQPPTTIEATPFPSLLAVDEPPDSEHTAADYMEDGASMSDGGVEESILEFCEPCTTREATRACEIRAFLEGRVGKARAREMLSKAKFTVAQDRTGRKNKVVKYGPSLLKLRA